MKMTHLTQNKTLTDEQCDNFFEFLHETDCKENAAADVKSAKDSMPQRVCGAGCFMFGEAFQCRFVLEE